MKIIFLLAVAIVIAKAAKLESSQDQVNDAIKLVDVVTSETEAIVNDVIREKRQFGGFGGHRRGGGFGGGFGGYRGGGFGGHRGHHHHHHHHHGHRGHHHHGFGR